MNLATDEPETSGPTEKKRDKTSSLLLNPGSIGILLGAICLSATMVSDSDAVVGGWAVASTVVLMLIGVPVAVALIVPSVLGVWSVSGIAAAGNMLINSPINTVTQWSFGVLPMFIFMGMLLMVSGITNKIYHTTDRWFSWLPGGLGIGTTAAGAGLASVSGSTIGMTYALARVSVPELLRAGYSKRVAVGTVMIAGMPGSLIPPSILLVVYAGVAVVPVGPQLIAGVLPGILVALTLAVFVFVIGIVAPQSVGRRERKERDRSGHVSWSERFKSLRGIWGVPVIFAVLFGGLFSGTFTATEAGAAAALTALVLTIISSLKHSPFHKIGEAAISTVSATASIFFILIGANALTNLLAVSGLAQNATEFIAGLGFSRIGFLLVMMLLYLFMGMFFDTISMMTLTVPFLMPTLLDLDISLMWYGIFILIMGEIGMVTPPFGIITFIVHNICQDYTVNLGHNISFRDIWASLAMFLPVVFVFVFLLILFPEVVEWLPGLTGG